VDCKVSIFPFAESIAPFTLSAAGASLVPPSPYKALVTAVLKSTKDF
jgi:hypothetical protein